jgi:hypothetical protein
MTINRLLTLLTFIAVVTSQCVNIWNGVDKIPTDMISYLYYGELSVNEINISGYVHMNYTDNVNSVDTTEDVIFTVYVIDDVDLSVGYDLHEVYKIVYENGYNGMFISSSEAKLTGEIMYFYSTDRSLYDIKRFEVREGYLLSVIDAFGTGAYFNITTTDECNPYFNSWMDYYLSAIFLTIWPVNALLSIVTFVIGTYLCITKWNSYLFIFKICICLYNASQVFRAWDAIFFVAAKFYRQGELSPLFEVSDVLGSLVGYSLWLSALVLYISHFDLSISIRIVDISRASRITAIIVSVIMCVLTVLGTLVLLLTRSGIIHRIAVIYFLLIFVLLIVYYCRLTFVFTSTILTTAANDAKMKAVVVSYLKNILAQNILLILAILCALPAMYVVSPVQTAFFPALVHIFSNIVTLIQFYHLLHVRRKVIKSTGSGTKSTAKKAESTCKE